MVIGILSLRWNAEVLEGQNSWEGVLMQKENICRENGNATISWSSVPNPKGFCKHVMTQLIQLADHDTNYNENIKTVKLL